MSHVIQWVREMFIHHSILLGFMSGVIVMLLAFAISEWIGRILSKLDGIDEDRYAGR